MTDAADKDIYSPAAVCAVRITTPEDLSIAQLAQVGIVQHQEASPLGSLQQAILSRQLGFQFHAFQQFQLGSNFKRRKHKAVIVSIDFALL